jgi:hypothetical protein
VPARLFCETCHKEVSAAHRLPEGHWLHRVTLAPVSILDRPKFTEGDMKMLAKKAPVKRPPKDVQDVKVPPKATKGSAKESPAERRKRLKDLAEERARGRR